MDFFERQDKARRKTKLLVFYFIVAICSLILAAYVAVFATFRGKEMLGAIGEASFTLWQPDLFFWTALGTLVVIAIGCAAKTHELSAGGSAVAQMLDGRLVNSNATEADERKLLNVVEEMAIASGIPVPQVYLLENEAGINAFAAGHSTGDAAIGVTRGGMKMLSRDQLQGVIGHEFSHILNGDMRLNVRLMGLIFGILCLTVVGRVLLRTRGKKNPLPLLGLALIIIGWIGVLFGRLIQAAVSRQREFLADAASVQFSRNPDGLAGALKKIGGLSRDGFSAASGERTTSGGSQLDSPHAQEASHLFFANGLRSSVIGLMSTHPPLEERIRALDPAFDGTFPTVAPQKIAQPPPLPTAAHRSQPPPLPPPIPVFHRSEVAGSGIMGTAIVAQALLPDVGRPTTDHLQYAADLRQSLPPALKSAARDPLGASALLYALLLSNESAAREKQLTELATATSVQIRDETLRVWPETQNINVQTKIPLVDLALPALRQLSLAQFQQFRTAIHTLVESDRQIDLFEYMLQKIVLRHLEPSFVPTPKPVTQFYDLKPLAADCGVLLSAMAYAGQEDSALAEAAFVRGAQPLSLMAKSEIPFLPKADCDLSRLDTALDRLAHSVPQIKKNVLNACAETVAADGIIQGPEAELLRAIADSLDCPIPPFIPQPVV
jgi:Zn-dependent protease with chaperone function